MRINKGFKKVIECLLGIAIGLSLYFCLFALVKSEVPIVYTNNYEEKILKLDKEIENTTKEGKIASLEKMKKDIISEFEEEKVSGFTREISIVMFGPTTLLVGLIIICFIVIFQEYKRAFELNYGQ